MAKKRKETPKRRLFRIRPDRVLHFSPQVVKEPEKQVWAREGVALDLTDDVLHSMAEGQEYKLEAIDEGEFEASAHAGLSWSEVGADGMVLRYLREQRDAAVAAPADVTVSSRKAQGDDVAPAPLPTPEDQPQAQRRAADVEAALEREEA